MPVETIKGVRIGGRCSVNGQSYGLCVGVCDGYYSNYGSVSEEEIDGLPELVLSIEELQRVISMLTDLEVAYQKALKGEVDENQFS